MSKLKMFTELKKNSWDVLDEYNSDKKFNIVKISRDYPEKILRTFCRCGYVSGNHKHDVCPECGQTGVVSMHIDGRDRMLKTKVTLETDYMQNSSGIFEDCVIGYSEEFKVNVTSSNEFEFVKTAKQKDFAICSDKAEIFKIRNEYKVAEIVNLYPYEIEGFKKYHSTNLSGLVEYINNKNIYPVLIQNIDKYPNIVNHIITKAKRPNNFEKISSWEEVYDLLNIPKKSLYPYINTLYKGIYYGYWSRSEIENKGFEEYNLLSSDLQSVADYFIIHGKTTIQKFKDACKILQGIDKKESEALKAYVRANYVIMGESVLTNYLKDTNYLRDKGMEVSITNLDTRNLNIVKNKEFITTIKKYNEKRTISFLNMFDLNPLESLQYLDSRRAPNKELRKQISEKLD